MKYSVMEDPVVAVRYLDGEVREIGLRQALAEAHRIHSILSDSPLERFCVLRLLIAMAMDMHHLTALKDRRTLLKAGSFSEKTIDDYISMCEKDGPRFDLFDERHPFMQSAYQEEVDDKAEKPVAALDVTLPSGNNHVFLDHRMASLHSMSPAEAFRALLVTQLFCTAGAQGYPSGVNNTSPVYDWVSGKNLFETIVLNMISEKEYTAIDYGYGDVPWRDGKAVIPKEEVVTVSLLEAFTWQPRRIHLICGDDGRIRVIHLQQGKNFKGNGAWRDPFVAYRRTQKGEFASVKPQSGRALWRDIGALISDKNSLHCIPPLVVSQAGKVTGEDGLLQIHQVGLVTSNAAYIEWMEDELSVPAFLFDEEYDILAMLLRGDVMAVETVQSGIARAVQEHLSSDTKHTGSLAEEARMHFLSHMHDVIFGSCIPDLFAMQNDMTQEAQKSHIAKFDDQLKKTVLLTFREIVENSGSTAKELALQSKAKGYAMAVMNKTIKEREEAHE